MGALFEALTRQLLLDFGSFGRSLAAGNAVDFESKWYQQAAAIREKHKVSVSFKPCVVYCFCLLFVLFIVFLLFLFFWFVFFGLFFFFWGCFFCLFFNY